MPDHRQPENGQQQTKSDTDWTRKGFGWVPDYPDIRDFVPQPSTLLKGTRPQKEIQKDGITEAIDDLTDSLIRIVDLLSQKSNLPGDAGGEVRSLIENLREKAFGGIRFNSARIYRLLKADIINQPESNQEQQKKDKAWKQDIFQLKRCLYNLIRDKTINPDDALAGESDKDFDWVTWITKPEFDRITKRLVIAFQERFNLVADGKVGINTFLTLERYFSYRSLGKKTATDSFETTGFADNSEQKKYLKAIYEREIRDLKRGLRAFIGNQYKVLQGRTDPATKKILSELPDTFIDFINLLSNEQLLSDSNEWEKWLQTPEFDDMTELLVRLFQIESCLTEDGVVRYDTFLKLKKFLAAPERFIQDRCNTEPTEEDNPAKLITVSSLVPDHVFSEMVGQLYPIWTDFFKKKRVQLCADLPLPSNSLIEVLKVIQQDKGILKDFKNDTNDSKFINLLPDEKHLQGEDIHVSRDQLVRCCSTEFIIIEPIVSVILMMISPLVNQSGFKGAVSEGMQKTEKLFQSIRQRNSHDDSDPVNDKADDAFLRKLAQAAHNKAKERLLEERKELVRAILNNVREVNQLGSGQTSAVFDDLTKELYPTLIFYSIIDKYLSNLWPNASREWTGAEPNTDQEPGSPTVTEELFTRQECFQLVLDKEEFGKEKHFQLYSSQSVQEANSNQTTSTGTPPDSDTLKDLPNVKQILSKPDIFERTEIVVPVSSAASRIKNRTIGQKELYFFLPGSVDLSYWCSPVEDQGTLNTCTACAGVGLLEYFAKRTFGEFEDLSSLFLYKAARNLRQRMGDVGAPLRDIMRSMILFGIPPERYWPYRADYIDEEPPAFCYSYAQNYQTLKYFRLDNAGLPTSDLLLKIKAVLAGGFPCMFGFTAYTSIYNEENIRKGYIPFPNRDRDRVAGGHSLVAVGYNDCKLLPFPDETMRCGAILVRNSWGRDWGMGGYGWLPYDYILHGLTGDWWSLLKAEWFGQGYFGLEARDPGCPPPPKQVSIPNVTDHPR